MIVVFDSIDMTDVATVFCCNRRFLPKCRANQNFVIWPISGLLTAADNWHFEEKNRGFFVEKRYFFVRILEIKEKEVATTQKCIIVLAFQCKVAVHILF